MSIEGKNFFKVKSRETPNLEGYHFEAIKQIEKGMVSLVEQLKPSLERGEYDTLISDEAGGRIPTLVIKSILERIAPGSIKKILPIAAGKSLPDKAADRGNHQENYPHLIAYIRSNAADAQKALVITQYLHNGGTMVKLVKALHEGGIQNVDVAASQVGMLEDKEHIEAALGANNKFIFGNNEWSDLHENHEFLSGVAKNRKTYNPKPVPIVDLVQEEGRGEFVSLDDWREIFDIQPYEAQDSVDIKLKDPQRNAAWKELENKPLTKEEALQIHDNMVNAREDVRHMADRIIAQVWNKKI